jgi:hypothetical protein
LSLSPSHIQNILLVTMHAQAPSFYVSYYSDITFLALHWIHVITDDYKCDSNLNDSIGSTPWCYWGWETLHWVWSVFRSKHLSVLAYVWFLVVGVRYKIKELFVSCGCIAHSNLHEMNSFVRIILGYYQDSFLGKPQKLVASVQNYPWSRYDVRLSWSTEAARLSLFRILDLSLLLQGS